MKLKSVNTLKSAVAMVLLGGAAQMAQAATATFDPATNIVNIPVVDVRSGSNVSSYTAQLKLNNSGQLELVSADVAASKTGDRVTYFADTNAVHFPSVQVLGSNEEYYAKLSVVPGSDPLAFSLDQLVPTSFTGCPSFASDGPAPGTCVLSGNDAGIQQNITLTANTTWILSGGVYVGGDNSNSATVTINPGTEIVGEKGADFLYVRRGSKIMAEGTPDQPIVMTGPLEQAAGEWGGLLLAGNAPVNGCAEGVSLCELAFEAITTEKFGGNNAADDSGLLKYVQIKYAGNEVRPDQELNGLTMLGVGTGTVVDYVQIHTGLDDGIEMFGGTVQLKHMVLTSNGDDSLDWGSGWRGKAQFVLIKQAEDDGDRGIEADNNEDNNDATPRAQPLLSNITALGSPVSTQGALFRRGTGVNLYNSVFTGFGSSCIRLDGTSTYLNGGTPDNLSGSLTVENTYVDCALNFEDKDQTTYTTEEWFNAQSGNVAGDPLLDGFYPAAGSPLLNSAATADDSFIEKVTYIGAFKDANDRWVDEWTVGLQ